MSIRDQLFELQDKEYAEFQAKLTPGVSVDSIIGVRVPKLRAFAKHLIKDADSDDKCCEIKEFLNTLPHKYYDENILHGILISEIRDYEQCVQKVEEFLPYVDNWAVCDGLLPKIFQKNKEKLLVKINEWVSSKHTYTCRFGIRMLMNHFLDKDFKEEYIFIPGNVISQEYYVNMMIAWFYATALAKQWDAAVKILEKKQLGAWTHNKTIQKACESYRISPEQKEYLKTLKI